MNAAKAEPFYFYGKGLFMVFVLLIAFMSPGKVQAQDTAPAAERKVLNLALEGMVGITTNARNTFAINVGGPNIRLKFNSNFSIGAGALPSLLVVKGQAEPKLGLAPRVDYKNLVFMAPAYHRSSDHSWTWTYGIGYKFH
ncbi:hypothetical protein FVR03_06715 [Pontibacter qinzhouensis]|uniref:Uncharacterized protein n=2 Tax=Pontibacter qinzhouensis TaxID=2603253 RepID=A0A5C8KCU3_9BACT|nr:hypothetical protein FVR03_06715 [Pontibacter qinzhouensis]